MSSCPEWSSLMQRLPTSLQPWHFTLWIIFLKEMCCLNQLSMAQRGMLPQTKTYLLQLEVSKGFVKLVQIELRTPHLNQL